MKASLIESLFHRVLVVVLAIGLAAALASAQGPQQGPQRVGGNVMQANLISKVTPLYPQEAKVNGIQGTVKLQVTVDKDGHVSELAAISGPSELIQSATDAVKQWVYKPTLLNGEPVSVLTTVDVNYTLTQ